MLRKLRLTQKKMVFLLKRVVASLIPPSDVWLFILCFKTSIYALTNDFPLTSIHLVIICFFIEFINVLFVILLERTFQALIISSLSLLFLSMKSLKFCQLYLHINFLFNTDLTTRSNCFVNSSISSFSSIKYPPLTNFAHFLTNS